MPTYLFSGEYEYFFKEFAAILDARGWKPAITGGILDEKDTAIVDKVNLLYVTVIEKPTPHMAKNTYKIKCEWQNQFTTKSKIIITDKATLHKNFRGSMILAETETLDNFVWDGTTFIARPSGRGFHSGKDIMYIYDKKSWRAALKKYKNYSSVIVSQVLENPILFKGRKFHIRLYLFIATDRVKISPIGLIYTAAKPYQNSNWEDMEIHDTHEKSTDGEYIFPADFPVKEYLPIMRIQFRQLEELILPHSSKFIPYIEQSDNGFELFAIDVMVQAAGYMRLLEINDKVGYPATEKPQRELAKWVADEFLHLTKTSAV